MRIPRPRLPRRTARLRLALLCGGVFVLGATAMIAIVNLVAASNNPHGPPLPPALVYQIKQIERSALDQAAFNQAASDREHLLIWSGIALAVAIAAAAVLGWFIAGRVLRPLSTITAAARRISASNLHQRLALPGPHDELKELGDTLDDLFARLEASFDAQRRFVANASHELRTPLTRERALLQVTRANPARTLDTWQAVSADLLASNAEQEHLIEALLTLASSEGGPGEREPVDLASVGSACLAAAGPETGRLGLQVRADIRPAALDGDPVLLRRLVSNLIQNAVRHNVPGGHIQVTTRASRGHAVVSVTNSGQVIPPAEVDRMFQPFQRLGGRRARGDGHGLGLSIVRAIAAAHGAAITAQPVPGGGLAVAVSFPAPAPLRAGRPRAGQAAGCSAALCPRQPHDGHRALPRPERRASGPVSTPGSSSGDTVAPDPAPAASATPARPASGPDGTWTSPAAAAAPGGCTRSAGNFGARHPGHRAGGFQVTCRGCQPGIGKEPDGAELAAALARVHEGPGGYRGRLPGYRSELSHVAGVLGDPARAPALPARDRHQAGPVSGCGPAAAWNPCTAAAPW